jgi:hypothetical protein
VRDGERNGHAEPRSSRSDIGGKRSAKEENHDVEHRDAEARIESW